LKEDSEIGFPDRMPKPPVKSEGVEGSDTALD
jgi:hypothetical protein